MPPLDRSKLEAGEVLGTRGPLGKFVRGIYAESAFFIKAPVPVAASKLVRWDSSRVRGSGVRTYRAYTWPAQEDFAAALRLDGGRREDRWLIEQTWEVAKGGAPTAIHVTPKEAAALRQRVALAGSAAAPAELVTGFWQDVLRSRSSAVASSGVVALPTISAGNAEINPRRELESLMGLAPGIVAHFAGLIGSAPFGASPPRGEGTIPFWEAALVRGHTSVLAGFVASQRKGDTWQVAKCTYYVSDTYFLSVSLYELLPFAGGTLVWQIDFVSAPFRAFTGGVDRVFAGRQMLSATAGAARMFRETVEQKRYD